MKNHKKKNYLEKFKFNSVKFFKILKELINEFIPSAFISLLNKKLKKINFYKTN